MIFKNYMKPTTLDEAYQLLTEDKQNVIVGGGAWLKLRSNEFDTVIDLGHLELDQITEDNEYVHIGSNVTLRQIETSTIVHNVSPIFIEAIKSIMGMNIRNIATIGGSIVGKFSFSDILTPLLVMDTTLVFHNEGDVHLQEFLNNKKFPKDILTKVKIKKERYTTYFKTVKKTSLDFAVLNLAITKGDTLRIAVGARPGTAKRAFESEKLNTVHEIVESVVQEISVSSNTRSSKEYREELLKVYIERGLKEVFNRES